MDTCLVAIDKNQQKSWKTQRKHEKIVSTSLRLEQRRT